MAASICISAIARCAVTLCACQAFCCFGVSRLAHFSGSISLQGVISSVLEQSILQARYGRGMPGEGSVMLPCAIGVGVETPVGTD